jgi:bifunctional DNA-binding transcriptional regulator/antitoxin component of YhaV-PrlF toxin-antitoxin module
MRYTTTLLLDGKSATGVSVPPEVVEALGGGGRIPVRVSINGVEYASSVATMKGQTRIPVSADIRSAAGIAAGDTLDVDVVRDDTPRAVEVPDDLQAALDDDPAIGAGFASLSYSHQRRHVLSVTAARTAETRERRIAAVVAELTSARQT